MKDEEEFVGRLGCRPDELLKVVAIFGNTGEGKSHTLNHTFFLGREVFKTSPTQESCTVGVWAAMDPVHCVVVIDTEGLLGAGMELTTDLSIIRKHRRRLFPTINRLSFLLFVLITRSQSGSANPAAP